jgi:hypothetical protein
MNRTLLVLFFAVALVLTSCGGGGGGGGSTPPPVNLTVTQASSPYGLTGQPFPGAQVTATGGTAPYSFAATLVPTGMTFSSDGKLTGTTPSNEGNYIVVVTASDSAGHTGSGSINFAAYRPLSATISFPEVDSGFPYQGSLLVQMNQSNLTVTARVVAGALPTGLNLNATGGLGSNPQIAITGTPTQSGIFSFTVELKDSLTPPRISQVPLKMFIDVRELRVFTSSPLNRSIQNQPYQTFIVNSGGVAPITCGLAAGSGPLPAGLAPGPNCSITGTPTQIGNFDFTWQVSDSGTQQQTVNMALSLLVVEPVKIADLPDAVTGENYTAPLQITGGVPPYSISFASLQSCCYVVEKHDRTLHGVPHLAGLQNLFVGVQDSGGQFVSFPVRLNVTQGPFQVHPDGLPRLKVGQFLQGAVTAVSGTRPITWTLESGTLPPGVTINSIFDTASLAGTPTTAGIYPAVLLATDSSAAPKTLHVPLSLQVYAKLPRNDSVPLADFLPLGGATRSFSPFADPVDLSNPDQDYHHFRAFAGETYKLSAGAASPTDTVIEVVDVNGQRFSTCRDPGDDTPDVDGNVDLTPLAFDDACRNDDLQPGGNVNSELLFRVPGASGTTVDFYLHVLEFRGDARPDMIYGINTEKPTLIP